MFIGEKKIARPFRWGIVGGGRTSGVGYKHRLGAMRDNTSFVLKAAAFDLDFARCVDFGKNLNMDEERLYPDYKTMFAEEAKREDGIEAVDIATPNFQHFEVCKAALEAGLHVICEKPLFFKVEEGEEIKALTCEDRTYLMGRGYMPEGFDEALIGMEPGQTKEFTFEAPLGTENGEVVNKPISCTVTVKEIQQEVVLKKLEMNK